MAEKYVFENEDSDDQKAEEEEQTILSARDTWVGFIFNSPFCVWVVLNLSTILFFFVPVSKIFLGGCGQLHPDQVQGGNISGESARENDRRWLIKKNLYL